MTISETDEISEVSETQLVSYARQITMGMVSLWFAHCYLLAHRCTFSNSRKTRTSRVVIRMAVILIKSIITAFALSYVKVIMHCLEVLLGWFSFHLKDTAKTKVLCGVIPEFLQNSLRQYRVHEFFLIKLMLII